jgi:hypothetical protein
VRTEQIKEIIERERDLLSRETSDNLISKFTMLDVLNEIEELLD